MLHREDDLLLADGGIDRRGIDRECHDSSAVGTGPSPMVSPTASRNS
jgi:hypothetical protein